jgi:molecular chaperone Hsp33
MTQQLDTLQRFIFEHAPIRGEIVRLEGVWKSVLERHDYPAKLQNMMGELCAAAALLAATLKLKGSLILQIHGTAAVKLLVVECTGELEIRATAKWEDDLLQGTLAELVGDGRFVITLDPKDGSQVYQGIVPLEGDTIADIMQGYMTRSEQLETRLYLAADGQRAGGMLLQKMPNQPNQDDDAWARAGHLANTLKANELLALSATELLNRLYHEEDIRVFDEQSVVFRCQCSRENVARMLRMLGREEIDSILLERDTIEVHCEFCNQRYQFDRVDAEASLAELAPLQSNETRH